MKVIIAGSRTIESRVAVIDAINNSGFEITEVVSGACPSGVDRIGEDWAKSNQIPVTLFPADWETHGYAAGPLRNSKMAQYADALILIWDGKSRGSRSMMKRARVYGLLIHEKLLLSSSR